MVKNNIIIITPEFLPTPSANGVCAYNLAKVLMHRGYSIEVISSRRVLQKKTETIDGIAIRRIKNQAFINRIKNKNFQALILRINLFLHLAIYPLDSICAVFRYFWTTINVIKQNDSSMIISLNNPLIGCLSGVYAKKKFGDKLKFIVYDVDSFSNVLEGQFIKLSKKKKMMWKWEKKVFQVADLAIIMRNHEAHYNQERYRQFRHKMRIANFPMLYTHLADINRHQTDNMKIEFVYLGTLSQTYRNPKIVCDLFSKIPNVNLKFFGKIDDSEAIIKQYSEETQGRINHGGMVSFLQGQKSLQNADVLISIGNRDSDMVPSKTFEYMSFCKPIIHFFSFREDPVIPTLKQYPSTLLLDANESVQILVEQTKEFLSNYSKTSIDSKKIREFLHENTPEFSIDLIEDFLAQ